MLTDDRAKAYKMIRVLETKTMEDGRTWDRWEADWTWNYGGMPITERVTDLWKERNTLNHNRTEGGGA